MRKHTSITILGIVTAALAGGQSVLAAPYVFNEPFNAPPLTPGTDDYFNEDGFKTGENGWILIEQPATVIFNGGGTNFGQRSLPWPDGSDSAVSQVRVRASNPEAYAIRDLTTPLISGNVSMSLTAYAPLGNAQYALRIATGGGVANALHLNFGSNPTTKLFEMSQTGYQNVTVADSSTTASGGAPLKWTTDFGGNADYATVSVDFDAINHTSSVVITTINSAGVAHSTSPFALSLDPSVTSIDRISLNARNPGEDSLSYIGNFSINGETVPEPGMISLAAIAGVALMRRRTR